MNSKVPKSQIFDKKESTAGLYEKDFAQDRLFLTSS